MRYIVPLLLLLLTGCVVGPSAQEIATADYGQPPNADYQEQIKSYMLGVLKDPMSAQYVFEEPQKGWMHDAVIAGGKIHYAWKVDTKINAKNGFGAYIGFQSYTFWFRHGKIVDAADANGIGFTPTGQLSVTTPE